MQGLIDSYVELIDQLLEDRITGDEFQTQYFEAFKNETRGMGDAEFRILDWLFAEVDDYTPDPDLRKRAGGLDDDELKDRVETAKNRLLELIQ